MNTHDQDNFRSEDLRAVEISQPPWRITRHQEHDVLVDDGGIQKKAKWGRG